MPTPSASPPTQPGVLVQPLPSLDRQRQPCRRGHFVVQIADRDHVFFEYLAKQTGAAIGEMFRGFTGYVQADAVSVHHVLFLPLAQRWRNKSASEIKTLRDAHLRPHTDAFFVWAQTEYDRIRNQRGLLRTALGYAVRQREPLTRFYDDGRLKLDNASERELRRIAIGRKNWLFVGSDDHAQAAGNLLTLIASARLHGLDPEAYLRDVFRVLPYWARDRYLEFCPRDWLVIRARLDPTELERELAPSPCRSSRPRR